MELYSYDKYRGYTLVVETLANGLYEGVYYGHSYYSPIGVFTGESGDIVRELMIEDIDWMLED